MFLFGKTKTSDTQTQKPDQPMENISETQTPNQISPTPAKPDNTKFIILILIGALLAVLIPLGVLVLSSQENQSAIENQQQTSATPPVCQAITITDTLNQPLTQEQLTTLRPFDEIKIAVSAPSPLIDKARFRVNGSTWQEITIKSDDAFIGNYIIPQGIKKFTIEAEVHTQEEGWL